MKASNLFSMILTRKAETSVITILLLSSFTLYSGYKDFKDNQSTLIANTNDIRKEVNDLTTSNTELFSYLRALLKGQESGLERVCGILKPAMKAVYGKEVDCFEGKK